MVVGLITRIERYWCPRSPPYIPPSGIRWRSAGRRTERAPPGTPASFPVGWAELRQPRPGRVTWSPCSIATSTSKLVGAPGPGQRGAVRPLPELTPANEWFWTSGADDVLRIQECSDC